VAVRIDVELSQPIRYPLQLLVHGSDNPAALAFYEYLGSQSAARVFRASGFEVIDGVSQAKPTE
jgi:ABC-type molybdate transport system substrate-binding protein